MKCRRKDCRNNIPRPTPRGARNGYCSHVCEFMDKQEKDVERGKS